ncbi:MAG: DUF5677 domain-containing protein [Deltaproteobacteria bacterium]|nr:DUF5677 domain-containing protein [Deltaproteobacteria bacterium]
MTGLIDKLGRPARLNDTGVLLFSLMSNGHAIKGLISSGFFSEGYIIGRSFFEKCVNFCYLNVCDDEEYDNHLSWTFGKIVQSVYARQKAHINLGEEIPLPEISKIIKDEKKLEKIIGKKGGKKLAGQMFLFTTELNIFDQKLTHLIIDYILPQ